MLDRLRMERHDREDGDGAADGRRSVPVVVAPPDREPGR